MADIQRYLDDIKQAVYGEEVRGSIHDAIAAINTFIEEGKTEQDEVIIDTNNWDSDKKTNQYSRLVAKITFDLGELQESSYFQSLSFRMNAGSGEVPAGIRQYVAEFVFRSSGINYVVMYRYHTQYKDDTSLYAKNFGVLYKSDSDIAYLILDYDTNDKNTTKLYLSEVSKTPGIKSIDWIFKSNSYLDRSKLVSEGYQFKGYNLYMSSESYYNQPKVTRWNDGLVSHPESSGYKYIFGTDSRGYPNWLTADNWGFQTSAQVQEAISTAIASADFSSFEIVSAVPDPSEAKENKFYLVKNEKTSHYDIYAKIGEKVEWIDDTTVDLTDYATKEELPTSVSELENDANYTSLTEEQYNTLLQLLGE